MDDNERLKAIIIPSIFSLLCLCVTVGGVFLVLHVFFPALSQPWHPVAALILIASPWLVWIVTYIYACGKSCSVGGDRQLAPTRQTTRSASGGKRNAVAPSNGPQIP